MNLRDLITEKDNNTLCPVRVIALIGSLEFLGIVGYNALTSHVTTLTELATGLGVLIGSVSAAVTGKARMSEKEKDADAK